MDERRRPGGFTLVDGAALVIGAAVASVHFREQIPQLTGVGHVFFWGAFSGVALTSAGPSVWLARRFARGPSVSPGLGEGLWAILGLPWMITALLRTSPRPGMGPGPFYVSSLWVGVALASAVVLGAVWKTWVAVPPDEARRVASAPWTNRLGLALAVAWPLQFGFALLLLEDGPGSR